MKKFGIFVLGMIFGVIFFFAALIGGGYIALSTIAPSADFLLGAEAESIVGDMSNMSLLDIGKEIASLYETKDIKSPNAEGMYYTLGDFEQEYNANITQLLGMEATEEVKAIPIFSLFTEGGVDKVLQVTPLVAILSIASVQLPTAMLDSLGAITLGDFLDDPTASLGTLTIGAIIGAEEEMDGLMNALKDVTLNDLISGNTGDVINDLSLRDVLGDEGVEDGLFSAFADVPIGELNDETSNMLLGSVLAFEREQITNTSDYPLDVELSPAVSDFYVKSNSLGTEFILSSDNDTWYLGELNCREGHADNHSQGCYKYQWFSDDNGTLVREDGISGMISSLTIKDMQESGRLNAEIQQLTLREVLGDDAVSEGMFLSLADTQLDDLNDAMGDLSMGALMGYVTKPIEDITTYNTDVITDVVKSNASGQFAKYDTEDDQWYHATILCADSNSTPHTTHTADCYKYIYYDRTCSHTNEEDHVLSSTACYDQAGGIMGAIAGLSNDEMKDDIVFQRAIDGVKFGDVMSIPSNASPLLISLEDKNIGEIPQAIDDSLLGVTQGLYRKEITDIASYSDTSVLGIKSKGTDYARLDDDKWYQVSLSEVSNPTAQDYPFIWYNDQSCMDKATKLDNKMGNLTIESMRDGNPITDIVADLNMNDFIECGIVDFGNASTTGTTANKLDKIFVGEDWREFKMEEFIIKLVDKIPTP